MMITASSAERAFHKVLHALDVSGKESAPRGMKIKELLNVCIEIKNPRARIISCPERKFSAAYAFGELAWYLSGRNDVAMMEYYSKYMRKGSDDGKTLNSAYGYRIFKGQHPKIGFDQWENVKRLLSEDADSRQAIIHLHTPNNQKTNDEVCTMSLQFLLREEKLNLIVTMRSNDIVLGFTYDVFAFTFLQELMANELGVEVGTYFHNAGSMHIYENKYYLLEKHTESKLPPMEKFSFVQGKKMVKDFISYERRIRGKVQRYEKAKLINNDKWISAECIMIAHAGEKDREATEFEIMYMTAFLVKAAKVLSCSASLQSFVLDVAHKKGFETVADIVASTASFECGEKIVVEGPDKAGKSKFIEENFWSMSNQQRKHYSAPSERFEYFKNYMYNLCTDTATIFDRFWISELVYGTIVRKDVKMTSKEIDELMKESRKAKFYFVLAINGRQLGVLKERARKSKEDFEVPVEDLNYAYCQIAMAMAKEKFNVKIIDIYGHQAAPAQIKSWRRIPSESGGEANGGLA